MLFRTKLTTPACLFACLFVCLFVCVNSVFLFQRMLLSFLMDCFSFFLIKHLRNILHILVIRFFCNGMCIVHHKTTCIGCTVHGFYFSFSMRNLFIIHKIIHIKQLA